MSGIQHLEVVERAVRVLRTINAFDGVSVSELARLSGVTRAATNRYLVTLEALGYVERNATTRKYSVTRKVLDLSAGATRDDWVTIVVQPILVDCCRQIGWPLSFGTIRNSKLSVLANTDVESPLIVHPSREHLVVPLVGRAAGHVLLAAKSETVRQDILSSALINNPNLYTQANLSAKDLKRLLEQTQAQGYATSKLKGMNWATLSVPVQVGGSVEFSVSTRVHPTAVSIDEAIERFLAPLQACANTLSAALQEVDRT